MGMPGAPAIAAWLMVAFSVGALVAIPLRLDDGAISVIATRLSDSPIEATSLQVDTIVDISERSDDNLFLTAAGSSSLERPSMFRESSIESTWLELPRFVVRERNGQRLAFVARLTLRAVEDIDSVATSERVADPVPSNEADPESELIDISITPATADALGVTVGDVLLLGTDAENRITRTYEGAVLSITVRIASLVELTSPSDPAWFGDDALHEPRKTDTHDGFEVRGHAVLRAEDLLDSSELRPHGSLGLLRRMQSLDVKPPTVATSEAWATELQRMENATPVVPSIDTPAPSSPLAGLLAELADARREASRTVDIVSATFAMLAALAVVRLVVHAVRTQQMVLAVIRARGASSVRISAAAGAVGAVAGGLGSLSGLGLATAVIGDGPGLQTALKVLAASSAGLGLIAVGAVLARTRAPLGPELRREQVGVAAGQRVADIVIVGLAVASCIIALRQAGQGDVSTGVGAVALVTFALGGGVVARRAVGLVARWAPQRSIAEVLAARHLRSGRSLAPLIADVMVIGVVALGVSGSVLKADADAVEDRSWELAAAPVRAVSSPGSSIDLAEIASLEQLSILAAESRLSGPVAVTDGVALSATILAVDLPAAVVLTEGDPRRPFGTEPLGSLQTSGRIPVLVPAGGIGQGPIEVGTRVNGIAAIGQLSLVVVGLHDVRQADGPVIVADRSLVQAALDRELLVLAVSVNAEVDVSTLAAATGVAQATDRSIVESELMNDALRRNLIDGVRSLMAAAFVVVIAVVAFTSLLVAHARRRQSALLDALGAPRRDINRAVLLELVSTMIVAVMLGLATTVLAIHVLEPAIGPPIVAGSDGTLPRLTLSAVWGSLAILVIGLAAALVVRRRGGMGQTGHLLRSEPS
jgi:hypothetical protein